MTTEPNHPGPEEPLRRLLHDAVPPLAAPADRLAAVGLRVRRRRRQRQTATAAGALTLLAAVTGLGPGGGWAALRHRGGAAQVIAAPAPMAPRLPTGPSAQPASPTGSAAPPLDLASGAVPPTGPPRSPAVTGATGAILPGDAPRATSPTRLAREPGVLTGLPGAAFDPAAVPVGAAGSAARRISATAQRPDPGGGVGTFRTVCQYARMDGDDLMARPARPGSVPLRTYWGNTSGAGTPAAADPTSTGRSTCRGGTVDRSVQWTAAVLTESGIPLAPSVIHVSYASGYDGIAPNAVHPLPAGLRMLAGGGDSALTWGCFGAFHPSAAPPTGCAAGDQVALRVTFPQCWNGRDLDSTDHRSHLTYPTGGHCPTDHPVALPQITFQVLYPPGAGGGPSHWRLSTAGLPTGYGTGPVTAPGGWVNGWDPQVSAVWAKRCVAAAVSCGSHLLGDGRALDGDL